MSFTRDMSIMCVIAGMGLAALGCASRSPEGTSAEVVVDRVAIRITCIQRRGIWAQPDGTMLDLPARQMSSRGLQFVGSALAIDIALTAGGNADHRITRSDVMRCLGKGEYCDRSGRQWRILLAREGSPPDEDDEVLPARARIDVMGRVELVASGEKSVIDDGVLELEYSLNERVVSPKGETYLHGKGTVVVQ